MPAKTLHNLPRYRDTFVGRESSLNTVLQQLSPSARTWLVAVWGIGGVGKSTLALQVAYTLVRRNSYDAIVWTSSKFEVLTRGGVRTTRGPVLTNLADLLSTIGKVLDLQDLGTSVSEQQRLTQILKDRRTLVIVDNLEMLDSEDAAKILWFVRDLLPHPSKALITSRYRLTGKGEYSVKLTAFSFKESIELIRNEAQFGPILRRFTLDHATMEHIHKRTGGIPLAIKWVMAQARRSRGRNIDKVLDRLSDAEEVPLLEYLFRQTYRELSRDAQDLMLSMSILQYPTSYEDVQVVSSLPEYKLQDHIDELVSMSLIEKTVNDRSFMMLPPTQFFARSQLAQKPYLEKEVLARIR